MSVSGEPITKCPICRYDLTGLPKNHTCPECGFEYDESMRIWSAGKPGWTLAVTSTIPAVVSFGMLFYVNTKVRLPGVTCAAVCLPALIPACISFILTVLDRRNNACMIVSAGGLYLVSSKHLKFNPWNELVVPPPSDLLLRRPMESDRVSRKQRFQSWLFLRVLTRDLGGFNFHRTIFKKGVWQRPLRLQFGPCNAKTRRVAYEEIYKIWLATSLAR